MPTMEQVDRLRAYADITVEEARDILAETGDDLLEAVILLEKRGKIKPPPAAESATEAPPPAGETPLRQQSYRTEPPPGESFGSMVNRFLRFLGRLIHKGNINKMEVHRRGEHILSLPVTVLVILLLVGFWCVIPLLVVGLFFDYRYSFRGPNMRDNVNHVMGTAADTAQTIKRDIKESAEKNNERDNSDR